MRFMKEDLMSLKNSGLAQSPPKTETLQKIIELGLLSCGQQTTAEKSPLSADSKVLNGFDREPLSKFYQNSKYFVKGDCNFFILKSYLINFYSEHKNNPSSPRIFNQSFNRRTSWRDQQICENQFVDSTSHGYTKLQK